MDPSTGKILVVDDFEINRDLLKRRLAMHGYTIICAGDGREAIDLLEKEPFDLVLLDIMMPHMNGFDVLHFIKTTNSIKYIPVIMISALENIESIVKALEMGAEDYLPKPFNPVLLKARVEACLEKKRLRDRELLYLEELKNEKTRSDELLHIILPDVIVKELKNTHHVKPRLHPNVAILFCDVVNFTSFCNQHSPEEVVNGLQELVEHYEQLTRHYNIQKIKTIGDSFMCCTGLMSKVENPMLTTLECGIEMVMRAPKLSTGWEVRVGIEMGSVIGGIVGHQQYLYDIWGDAVNIASRLSEIAEPSTVITTRESWKKIEKAYIGKSLGNKFLKGIGEKEVIEIQWK